MMEMTKEVIKKRILYPLFFVVVVFTAGFSLTRYIQKTNKVRVVTYVVRNGWGYKIGMQDRFIIIQSNIPVIQGDKQFPNRRTARKAGKIVKQRILNKQLPSLTMEDLTKIGIDSLGNSR